ncbi:hypothetical protein NPIL_535371 [Nephila pilipes]|uniref:Uncharacterized protein n=1 Tax=Nephila pilipes TaxID=299642 RepID=A0A8X6PF65_NEPPI|nr:hypothetical protein NPIL_535371 [Nephila pilipes]
MRITSKSTVFPPEGRKNGKVSRKKRVIELIVRKYPFTKTGKFYNRKRRQTQVSIDPGGVNGFQLKNCIFQNKEKGMALDLILPRELIKGKNITFYTLLKKFLIQRKVITILNDRNGSSYRAIKK